MSDYEKNPRFLTNIQRGDRYRKLGRKQMTPAQQRRLLHKMHKHGV